MKSQITFKVAIWFYKIAFLTFVVFLVLNFTKNQERTLVDSAATEAGLLYEALLYNEYLMKYDTITERIYPGIVIDEKLKDQKLSENLDKSISFGSNNKHIAAKIIIEDKEFIFNPGLDNGYERWKVLANRKIKGPGSARGFQFSSPIVLDGKIPETKKLTVHIVKPNS